MTLSKKFPLKETMNIEFRAECFNVLDSAVYQVPGYTTVTGSQVRLADAQASLPYTAGLAGGGFGALTNTVSNTVGSGTNRQFQLALRFNF